MTGWPLRLMALALIGAGAALMLWGAWIPVKAAVGQVLLTRAWDAVSAGEVEAKPWPWADMQPALRLLTPDHGIDQIVLDQPSGQAMAWGPTLVARRSGAGAVTVLAGHRDTHFAFLEHLETGDELVLREADGTERAYAVDHTIVLDEPKLEIAPGAGDDLLVLTTCWPFDAPVPGGPKRYAVVAKPVR